MARRKTDKEDLLIGERKRRQKLSRTYALAKEDLLIGERKRRQKLSRTYADAKEDKSLVALMRLAKEDLLISGGKQSYLTKLIRK
ncbi:hypothetical protein V1498_09020 [Peribacillus sp. SCS-26]|uniref:hypothetical protein n=1 Tax=Paraperibacillus marinus TaxID=3115295 RepID=UPI0039063C97